ncbi:hypothetical protein SDC9_133556 [bioreactor metagenome]|uniref:Uncharacterized protein n=1 Tax=bioreactor metagenome TaxID=1076179 RepID=A0A645DBA6_9ZZZZ
MVTYLLLRPIHLRWNATSAEVAQSMPGDLPIQGWTRAVTINATPEHIWPWLVQWGQGRGGWYSYDWLENLFGFQIHTADAILPEYQNPNIGDPICMAKDVCMSQVFVLEPGKYFGWQTPTPEGTTAWTFIIGLYPLDASSTRVVIRESFGKGALPAPALIAIELPDAVMEMKALQTLKIRAEGTPEPAFNTALEIALWLAALATGIIAVVLFIRRKAWHLPLALGLASTIVLMLITFLFLPLWGRALLDLLLVAATIYTLKK